MTDNKSLENELERFSDLLYKLVTSKELTLSKDAIDNLIAISSMSGLVANNQSALIDKQ